MSDDESRDLLVALVERGLETVAFRCINTGVFGFPQDEAAEIAVRTVRRWLDEQGPCALTIVFNVFGDADEALYRNLLGFGPAARSPFAPDPGSLRPRPTWRR